MQRYDKTTTVTTCISTNAYVVADDFVDKSPGMYVFHVASFFSAMTSPGMMIGASDLSLLIHMKSKSPAIGKDIGITQPETLGQVLKCRNQYLSNTKAV
jgi:hypothetical protein